MDSQGRWGHPNLLLTGEFCSSRCLVRHLPRRQQEQKFPSQDLEPPLSKMKKLMGFVGEPF